MKMYNSNNCSTESKWHYCTCRHFERVTYHNTYPSTNHLISIFIMSPFVTNRTYYWWQSCYHYRRRCHQYNRRRLAIIIIIRWISEWWECKLWCWRLCICISINRPGVSKKCETVLHCLLKTTAMHHRFFARLVTQSNKMARQRMAERNSTLFLGHVWKNISVGEMIRFFGIMLQISLDPRKMGGY